MATLVYPNPIKLKVIQQELLPRLTKDRLIFKIMPLREVDADRIRWEQKDNYVGLQQIRGVGGQPRAVANVGMKQYEAKPGYYGEFKTTDEEELIRRRATGTFTDTVDLSDLVLASQEHLYQRELDRIAYIGYTLLAAGTFTVSNSAGVVHTDTYTLRTYAAAIAWSNVATATPLANFRAVKLMARGYSTSFGRQAMAIMNQTTANYLHANTNANDLARPRGSGAEVISTFDLDGLKKYFNDQDLPTPVICEDGYYDEAGVWQLYIPDNVVIVVGQRQTGELLMEYMMTASANAPSGKGSYAFVKDMSKNEVPPRLEVHKGHNGGPAIYFPGSVIRMTV